MVTDADNPTPQRLKRAAALRYDQKKDSVPRLVAKGQGELAERIIALAGEHGVPVQEDKDLIDLLCRLEVDQLIPQNLFVAVAEVMAYLYRVNSKMPEWIRGRQLATRK